MHKFNTNKVKRIIDILMTVLLFFLMAYQVTGDILHEWIGIAMTIMVILHNYVNKGWYINIAKGTYSKSRLLIVLIDVLLLLSFFMSAFTGMAMSGHAVPFMFGVIPIFIARQLHLTMSYWAFVLMGVHIGIHMESVLTKVYVFKNNIIVVHII
ncbi:MAG: DUF4405 domain-containing protein, partial [Lachnospiraceae bacterium]|nr:DUF4405 domain-containing protein [Lachnospiraceae bacterium]